MRILHVNTTARGGGAAQLAFNLMEGCQAAGHQAWLAVREETNHHERVFALPNAQHRHAWARFCDRAIRPLAGNRLARVVGRPWSSTRVLLGHEDFDFPGSRHLLECAPEKPDVVHLHNLHGAFFDLRAVPQLSHAVPTFLTLHDAWMLSGHCSHSFDCDRWRTGCGECPNLAIYPPIPRDATAYNWRRKRAIFARSRLHIATPCRWLRDRLHQSVLAPAIASTRVVHHGIDLSVFAPGDRRAARHELNLPQEATILMFAAKGIRGNVAKDFDALRAGLEILATEKPSKPLLFLALGEDGPTERVGAAELRFVPHQDERRKVARYYQAADVYVHASRAEVWGLSITEAMACGLPVVASAVGGIPDQVSDGQNGFLFPVRDARLLAERVRQLLAQDGLRREMGERAAARARAEFGVQHMTRNYLAWYAEVLGGARGEPMIGR